jgi:TonB family protein
MKPNRFLTRRSGVERQSSDLLLAATAASAASVMALVIIAGTAHAQPAEPNGTTLAPVIEVHAAYPEEAAASALTGEVTLSMTVTPHGTVEAPRVTTAQPAGVFEQSALEAVSRWRYPADPDRASQEVSVTLRFQPPSAAPRAELPRAIAQARPATGPRNQCVREGAVYNYGDSIDLELMSACGEPLLVFSCAQGTGRHVGRWVCMDGESSRALLVPPGDERIGTSVPVEVLDSDIAFSHQDTFQVTRAPNSQYWWVACLPEDQDCRGIARTWARSLNLQPARVNPQHRTTIALARSH